MNRAGNGKEETEYRVEFAHPMGGWTQLSRGGLFSVETEAIQRAMRFENNTRVDARVIKRVAVISEEVVYPSKQEGNDEGGERES
jgi:hypothetical protein